MAKKPSKQTPKVPQASKKTRDAIAFFNDKKPATALLEQEDGRKTRKFKPSVRTTNDKFWDFVDDNKIGSLIVLALTVAAVSYAVYWVMTR